MASSVIWKRWVADLRTLQRRAKRDGYRMNVSIKVKPSEDATQKEQSMTFPTPPAREKREQFVPSLKQRLVDIETFANHKTIKAAIHACDLLERYIAAYPAFRVKPVGAPGSRARDEQERLMALEEAALAALRAARGDV